MADEEFPSTDEAGLSGQEPGTEDDFTSSPFTEYGDFEESKDEEEDVRFFQYGRFFGLGLSLGHHGVNGTRARLWEGGFPAFEAKIAYWFDFNFALNMNYQSASHSYDALNRGGTSVSLNRIGVDLVYYFSTRDAPAAIAFSGPHLLLGLGSYTKNEQIDAETDPDSDSKFGFAGGLGLEFPVVARKTYFTLQGMLHIVHFEDENTTEFENQGIPHLHGSFYTVFGGFLFTW